MRRILVLLLVVTAVHADDFEKKYRQFRKYINRPSLRKRVEGLEILASSGDVRALKVLTKVYAKPPKAPRDQTKYLTVSIAWDRFGEPEHVAAWEEWRNKFGKPTDAWLWFRALDINTMHNGAKTAMSVANSKRNIFLRAAAVHAVGVYHEPLILPIIPKFLEKRPERGLDRALLVEACGRALVRQINEVGTDEFRNAALKLMKQFDLKETPARTRWVLARCFARIFKSNKIYLESSAPWRQMLQAEDARTVKIDPRYAPQKRPTFVGIEATGKRIVYVIDMSDSMLTPLTAREQKILRGPVSGTRKGKKKKEEKDKSPLLAEKDLDWKKIKNRFDAAREYLIISLRSLEPDMHYAVIGFGEQADFFRSTPGLVAASKGAVNNTISELRAYRAGPKGDNRPHGTLKGTTNMHGGLRRAFMLRGKGMAKTGEYVDPKTFSLGCDTIFLLSDGNPTWDDWANTDSRDKGDRVGDPEMGGGGDQSATTLNFPGPYARNRHLFEDVQRMNLFRQVEIHGIGIGEASRSFLEALAGNGLGRVRMIGKSMGKPAEEKKN
ncbi:MAG: vWA domain-containing protein [Planctomycetota bacterium]|jgi:hypothetical protein